MGIKSITPSHEVGVKGQQCFASEAVQESTKAKGTGEGGDYHVAHDTFRGIPAQILK